MELLNLITLDQARHLIAGIFSPLLKKEKVGLLQALNRVLGEDISSPEDLPPFSRSIMDGYAVRACDTFGASVEEPIYLQKRGGVLMGEEAKEALSPGEAWEVATGAMIPPGADAVVMKEYTTSFSQKELEVCRGVAPGESLVHAGDDLKEGEGVLEKGRLLGPAEMGVLSALGITEVSVFKPPQVGILSTGDELVGADGKPVKGQIRDINSYTLAAAVSASYGTPFLGGIVPDTTAALSEALEKILPQVDLLLISGGSSVGTRDVTVPLLTHRARDGLLFHGLAVKPGKPTLCGVVEGKPVFGLPGHPVSVLVVFHLLVRPLLLQSLGLKELPPLQAHLTRRIVSTPEREEYVPVRLEEKKELLVTPVFGGSSLITTLVNVFGLIKIPLDEEGLLEGEEVAVLPFR